MVKPEREHEMAEAIARAEEDDELEDSDRTYVRPRPPRRSAGDVYTFRLPKERRDQLRESAERQGVPPATLIRQWVEQHLDSEARRVAVATVLEDATATEASSGSHALGSVLGPMKDVDVPAGFLGEQASEKQLTLLLTLGRIVPNITVVSQDVHRRATSALNDLADAIDQLVGFIGDSELLDLLEISTAASGLGRIEQRAARKTPAVGALMSTSNRSSRHVVPNPAGGWDIKAPGAKRVSSRAKTQADAVRRAREIVHNAGGGEVVIHGRDGKVRDSDTVAPGHDPNPPRDQSR